MAGRPVSVNKDAESYKKSKEVINKIEDETPIFLKQDFNSPSYLTKAEKKIWKNITQIFKETKNCRVSDADVDLLVAYCRAKARADEADAALKADPSPFIVVPVITDSKGKVKKVMLKNNPNLAKLKDNTNLHIKLFDELGLSPRGRAKLGLAAVNKKRPEDDLIKLMNRKDE